MGDRPKLTLPRSAYEWALDVVAMLLILGSLVYLVIEVPGTEGPVPTRFNFWGEPHGWGTLDHVWWVLGLAVIQYAVLAVLERFPQVYNYPPWVTITAANAARHYQLARTFVIEMKVLMVASFAVVLVAAVVMAKGGPPVVHGIWLFIGRLFVDIGAYVRRSRTID
jgi:hypothetical protein